MRTFVAVAIFGGGIAHATLGPALRIADVAPDIPLIVVVLLALRRGPEFGCGAGFVAGVLQDAAPRGALRGPGPPQAGHRLRVGAPRGPLAPWPPPPPGPRLRALSPPPCAPPAS